MANWGNGQVFAESDENGVLIKDGWSVGIPAKDCIAYVQSINTNPLRGFYRTSSSVVVFSHGTASIPLTPLAAQALVDMMVAQYSISGAPYAV